VTKEETAELDAAETIAWLVAPPFAVVEHAGGVDAVDLPFPLFVKPLAGGTSLGIFAASHVTSRSARSPMRARRCCAGSGSPRSWSSISLGAN
jgi:hypothetical protein